MYWMILIFGLAYAADGASPTAGAPDWLAGCWAHAEVTAEGDSQVLECWTDAEGGLMVGVGRTIAAGEAVFFEQLRIQAIDGAWTYVAAPMGGDETRFVQQDAGERWVVFSNPQHDFPQQIHYRRVGRKLYVTIRGVGKGGADQQMSWTLRRVRR